MIYANKDKYHGEWIHDMKNGEGIYQFSNGDIYQGHFKNDIKDGHGLFTVKRNVIQKIEGLWKDDKLEGVARYHKGASIF